MRLRHLLSKIYSSPIKEFSNPSSLLEQVPIWPLQISFSAAILCLFLSTFYHTCNCHSDELRKLTLRFDYAGICLLFFGTAIPTTEYAFACGNALFWGQFSGILMALVCCTTFVLVVLPVTNQLGWNKFRSMAFFLTGASGLVPLTLLATHQPDSEVIFYDPKYIFIGCFFNLLGALAYTFFFLECFKPGKFDIVGASHQIFHVCVLFGIAFTNYSNVLLLEKRETFYCQA